MAKNDTKQELARVLYMSGLSQEEILQKVEVSRQTLSRWINTLGWKEMKAARSITRPELVNKLLSSINSLLDKANEPGNEDMLASLGDKLIKTATAIEKLEKKASVVDRIDTMIDFENWLASHRDEYPQLTNELFQLVNQLHNDYLNEHDRTGKERSPETLAGTLQTGGTDDFAGAGGDRSGTQEEYRPCPERL